MTALGPRRLDGLLRTQPTSPELSDAQGERLVERQERPPDLVVVEPVREWTCTACGGTGKLLTMEDAGPLCLTCADLDTLVFVPAGDATLTRRAKKAGGLFPGCPPGRAAAIAAHTSVRGSGRVGRSAAGRALAEEPVVRAVVASVRHEDTDYDALLMARVPRDEARERILDDVARVLDGWRSTV